MRLSEIVKKTCRIFADILYPNKCIVCNCFINYGEDVYFCQKCRKNIKLNAKIVRNENKYFDEAICALPYKDFVKRAMTVYKFKGMRHYDKSFAFGIYDIVGDRDFIKDDVVITAVPIHPLRNREYNQSELIAKELCKLLDARYTPQLLIKIKHIPKQSKIGYFLRHYNIIDSIAFNLQYNIVGKRIVLIDDVYTTGSTVSECSRILKMYGAAEVYVLSACWAVKD